MNPTQWLLPVFFLWKNWFALAGIHQQVILNGQNFGDNQSTIKYYTKFNIKILTVPINGIDSLVSGILSAMANINTENAKITVTPRAIFSPTNYH